MISPLELQGDDKNNELELERQDAAAPPERGGDGGTTSEDSKEATETKTSQPKVKVNEDEKLLRQNQLWKQTRARRAGLVRKNLWRIKSAKALAENANSPTSSTRTRQSAKSAPSTIDLFGRMPNVRRWRQK